MYSTTGVDAIATITELRSKTSEMLEYVRDTRKSVLIQKNNEAYAVLIDWDTYQALLEPKSEQKRAVDRSPQHAGHWRPAEDTTRTEREG